MIKKNLFWSILIVVAVLMFLYFLPSLLALWVDDIDPPAVPSFVETITPVSESENLFTELKLANEFFSARSAIEERQLGEVVLGEVSNEEEALRIMDIYSPVLPIISAGTKKSSLYIPESIDPYTINPTLNKIKNVLQADYIVKRQQSHYKEAAETAMTMISIGSTAIQSYQPSGVHFLVGFSLYHLGVSSLNSLVEAGEIDALAAKVYIQEVIAITADTDLRKSLAVGFYNDFDFYMDTAEDVSLSDEDRTQGFVRFGSDLGQMILIGKLFTSQLLANDYSLQPERSKLEYINLLEKIVDEKACFIDYPPVGRDFWSIYKQNIIGKSFIDVGLLNSLLENVCKLELEIKKMTSK